MCGVAAGGGGRAVGVVHVVRRLPCGHDPPVVPSTAYYYNYYLIRVFLVLRYFEGQDVISLVFYYTNVLVFILVVRCVALRGSKIRVATLRIKL